MNRDELASVDSSFEDRLRDLLRGGHAPFAGSFRRALVCETLRLCDTHLRLLASTLAGALGARGCDGTFRHTRRFARRHGLRWPALRTGLRLLEAQCDCEALRVTLGKEPR